MDPGQAILGDSESTRQLRRYLPMVARSGAPVLITGETGTGKERVAEAVHFFSDRQKCPFVAVNCAALPDTLIESELFGFERGSFSGATTAQAGKAANADGGTLFLDEIGEMSASSQAKLLRFLETGAIDRIGASRPVPVNVRVVAATNQAIEELLQSHMFRADLFYRLNVARIELAPLRERPEDIGPLMQGFIQAFNQRYKKEVGPPDDDLISRLQRYQWPGNVRELRNMVEAIYIDPPAGALQYRHLPVSFSRLFGTHLIAAPDEKGELLKALRHTNWNKAEAAKLLKLSRMTIYRRIARYHLDQDRKES